MQKFPTDVLKDWFVASRRDLPWRMYPTPYRVWISEVMLQQTQVSVVIPYFEKWMRTFPNIEALAKAPLEQVLKCWEGLGYYSRARNLHRGAQEVLERYHGDLPSSADALATIPGIGPYTRGAILSFAFKRKAVALDGNVLRVLSRFLAYQTEIDTERAKKELHKYAESVLPNDEPWLVSEGLIELGALVCAKKAKCTECPLKKECLAYQHQLQDYLPKKRLKSRAIDLLRHVAVIECEERYFIQKGLKGKVMADLYEFPYVEKPFANGEELAHYFEKAFGMTLRYVHSLPIQKHTFTRFRAQLVPYLMKAEKIGDKREWKLLEELKQLPFSSGHKRVLIDLVQRKNENSTH